MWESFRNFSFSDVTVDVTEDVDGRLQSSTSSVKTVKVKDC